MGKKSKETCNRWYGTHRALIPISWSSVGLHEETEISETLKFTEELWQSLQDAELDQPNLEKLRTGALKRTAAVLKVKLLTDNTVQLFCLLHFV